MQKSSHKVGSVPVLSNVFTLALCIGITFCEYKNVGLIKPKIVMEDGKINRVLVIMPALSWTLGGVEKYYEDIAKQLKPNKICVDLLYCDYVQLNAYALLSYLFPKAWLSHLLLVPNPPFIITHLPGQYISLLSTNYYDAVHIGNIHCSVSLIPSVAGLLNHNVPFTVSEHTNVAHYIKAWLKVIQDRFGLPDPIAHGIYIVLSVADRILIKSVTQNASRVLTPTSRMRDVLIKYGTSPDKVVVCRKFIDLSFFSPKPRKEFAQVKSFLEDELKLKRPYLLCVSRIAPEKNLEEFFEMPYPGSKIMVGTGPLLEEYKQKYGHQVTFVGLKKGEELLAYYQNADVFVCASYSEVMPLTLLEAMACGTPIAAHPCMGPIDVVDEGITGCLRDNLAEATEAALKLNRSVVSEGAKKWGAEEAADTFLKNLVYIPKSVQDSLK